VNALWPALGAIAGLIAGSFLATLVVRWPHGERLDGRSACDGCGRMLVVRDLVPLVSWAIGRGRCRTCGAKIDSAHPLAELLCGAVGLAAFVVAPPVEAAFAALIGWTLVGAALLDIRHFWLPDVLSAAVAVLASLSSFFVAVPSAPDRLIGGAVGFGLLALVALAYRRLRGREGLGGGDPKLLGALGLWLGWQALPMVLLVASVGGLVVALVMKLRGGLVAMTTHLPFGALLAGTAFAVWAIG
jgi:leader peptidase (prepilin peptidase) / N-methyltransferase